MQHQESTEDLKHEIERTRARVAADVDAIGTKISPENVKYQMKQRVAKGVRNGMHTVKTSTRRAGRSLVSSARDNPMPLMLIGAGLGWLVYNARQSARRPEYYAAGELEPGQWHEPGEWREPGWEEAELSEGPSAKERVAYARERAGEKLHDVKERASEKMDQMSHRLAQAREGAKERMIHVREGASNFMHENPLAVGAVAMAIGAGVGMLLPHTQAEDRMVGERRDKLLERGKEKMRDTAEDAKQVVKHVADEATRVAEQDLAERGYDVSKGQTVPGGTQAPTATPTTTPDLSGPGDEFDSTLNRRF